MPELKIVFVEIDSIEDLLNSIDESEDAGDDGVDDYEALADRVEELLYPPGDASDSGPADHPLVQLGLVHGIGALTGPAAVLLDGASAARGAGEISGQQFEEDVLNVISLLYQSLLVSRQLDAAQAADDGAGGFEGVDLDADFPGMVPASLLGLLNPATYVDGARG